MKFTPSRWLVPEVLLGIALGSTGCDQMREGPTDAPPAPVDLEQVEPTESAPATSPNDDRSPTDFEPQPAQGGTDSQKRSEDPIRRANATGEKAV